MRRRFFAGAVAEGDQAGDAAPFLEFAADQMPGPLGSDQHDVDARRGFDLAEVDVEAVRTHQDVARLEIVADRLAIDVSLHLVGQQHVDDVGLARGLFGRQRLEAVAHGQVVVGAARALADDHGAAAVAQVLGVGMALRAVAQDGDRLALECRQIGIFVVINLGHQGFSARN